MKEIHALPCMFLGWYLVSWVLCPIRAFDVHLVGSKVFLVFSLEILVYA